MQILYDMMLKDMVTVVQEANLCLQYLFQDMATVVQAANSCLQYLFRTW